MSSLQLRASHQNAYRERLKSGLQPISKPWDWLTISDVQKLAVEAYRATTFALSDPDDQTINPRGYFAEQLIQALETLVADAAQIEGISCAPANAMHYAACLRADLPAQWRPQYPVYQKKAPASVCTTPEAMTNADEGNANAHDFKP